MKKPKIAVFISGPARYVDLVRKNLDITLKGLDFDCFYHLWKEDLGNKKREGYNADYISLLKDKKTKVFMMQEPYKVEDFKNSVGTETNSGSTINASMGMFMTINLLCNTLKRMPDSEEYTHILRLRTDCALFVPLKKFLSLNNNTVTVSTRPDFLSSKLKSRICDHIFFSSRENFLRFWSFENMGEIYKAYNKGNRNPEVMLRYLYKKRLKKYKLNQNLISPRDYQIIYSPPKDFDPNWTKRLMNKNKIKGIFINFENHYKKREVEEILKDKKYNSLPYCYIDNKIFTKLYKFSEKHPKIKKPLKKLFYKVAKNGR
jgi:hypothetical protein